MDIKNGTGDYLRKGFLKFNMSGIPADSKIESAKLFVYGGVNDSRVQNGGISVHEVGSNNWSETALTWNNMPTIGAQIGKITVDKDYGWRQFDVTSFAESRLKLDGQMSLALQGDSDLTVTFKTREGDGGIYKSYLEITFKPNVPVTGISLSSEQAVLAVGEVMNLKAVLAPLNATNKELKWSIDRDDVLKLEPNGTEAAITALKPGRARITVITADGKLSSVCEVKVVLSKIAGDLNGDGKITVGDLGIAAANFGKDKTSPDWDAVEAADINGNGIIDSDDLKWFADQMLK
ncbi:DNRLRE domain-containing protein [Paenibacillus sp. D2_2]|nr:DNRLRE domain-containing protein [Paenibacillus sp. D2_2]WMT43374.1 DNRLRE domain-containing protein [Paenibacillus sp. D2_2]